MTVIVAASIIFSSVWITLELNSGLEICNQTLGVYIGRDQDKFLTLPVETQVQFCDQFIDSLNSQQSAITTLTYFVIVFTIGLAASFFQKLVIFKIKDNVKLDLFQCIIEFTTVVVGLIFIIQI